MTPCARQARWPVRSGRARHRGEQQRADPGNAIVETELSDDQCQDQGGEKAGVDREELERRRTRTPVRCHERGESTARAFE